MRLRDYITIGWDQLRRRKVVTLLCVMGIAIGSASIIVALAFGESIAHYSQQQMSRYLKTDEITIMRSGERVKSTIGGPAVDLNAITDQKLSLIRALPHVKSVASYSPMGMVEFVVDSTKSGRLDLLATDLTTLSDFGMEVQQGALADMDNAIVLTYSATVGLRDTRTAQMDDAERARLAQEGKRDTSPLISYPLYQKQLRLVQTIPLADGTSKKFEYSVRVIAIEKMPANASDDAIRYSPKLAYVSPSLARQFKDAASSVPNPAGGMAEQDFFSQVKVKVDSVEAVADTEKMIKSLKLQTMSNLSQQESFAKEFAIVRIIFGGAGLFILFVASISIVVAMTMSTHQRRRQIGIMKVLGANLAQIRNMFVCESALLGVLGGVVGICLAYWVIWGINILVIQFSGTRPGQDPEILFISLWILPLGMFFALLTGILSGILPAIKASRTDALTAIKRE